MTKTLIYLLALISLTAISCGAQATWPAVLPTTYQQIVLPLATETIGHITETVTMDETNLQYTVTAPLHIRKCASINCDILAYLQPGDSVVVKFSVAGPGCAGADWYAVALGDWTGFVCSIYVEAK